MQQIWTCTFELSSSCLRVAVWGCQPDAACNKMGRANSSTRALALSLSFTHTQTPPLSLSLCPPLWARVRARACVCVCACVCACVCVCACARGARWGEGVLTCVRRRGVRVQMHPYLRLPVTLKCAHLHAHTLTRTCTHTWAEKERRGSQASLPLALWPCIFALTLCMCGAVCDGGLNQHHQRSLEGAQDTEISAGAFQPHNTHRISDASPPTVKGEV